MFAYVVHRRDIGDKKGGFAVEMLIGLREFWREMSSRVTLRRDTAPIDTMVRLDQFVSTRSAFIAQKTLYGYLKTRMGTRYPLMFEDDTFVHSINIAKLNVFAGCLSDLTIHAIAHATRSDIVSDAMRESAARHCFRAGLTENTAEAPKEFSAEQCIGDFDRRLMATDWSGRALRWENFTCSPKALVEWAPIAPELKQFDREIVENSITFAWRDIREQLDKRLDPAAIIAEIAGHGAS